MLYAVHTVFESIEPALAFARACLHDEQQEPRRQYARDALGACRTFLELHGPPQNTLYDPASVLEESRTEITEAGHVLETDTLDNCVGDPTQVAICVSLLVKNWQAYDSSGLALNMCQRDVPCLDIEFTGPGRFPDRLTFGGYIFLLLDNLLERWTCATRGGRIDTTPNGMSLRLSGMREVPESIQGLEPALEQVLEAERQLELAAVDSALELVDGATAMSPGDLGAVLAETVRDAQREASARSIAVETYCDENIPAVLMRRTRLRSFFANAFVYATEILERGGALAALVDYDQAQRAAGIAVTISGTQCEPRETCRLASMRRAIVDIHGGIFDLSEEDSGVTVTASLPDVVGRALDERIPGNTTFSDRSQQMLRLAEAGFGPPEDFLLAGVLEDELERWLLPALADAPAVNMAHDIDPGEPGLPDGSPSRLKKVLGQVRRGKPRKEICQPAHAAEILWAFRVDERHRKAVKADRLDKSDLEALCTALSQHPPDYVTCLNWIARVRGG